MVIFYYLSFSVGSGCRLLQRVRALYGSGVSIFFVRNLFHMFFSCYWYLMGRKSNLWLSRSGHMPQTDQITEIASDVHAYFWVTLNMIFSNNFFRNEPTHPFSILLPNTLYKKKNTCLKNLKKWFFYRFIRNKNNCRYGLTEYFWNNHGESES